MRHFHAALGLASLIAASAHAASPVALYDFDNTLAPVTGIGSGAASALVSVDPLGSSAFESDVVNGVARNVYRFNGSANPASAQGGLQFVDADLMNPSSYSVELYFSFDQVSGWRRILDTKDRSTDQGFYVLNGGLQLYPSNVGVGTFAANTYYHVLLTFDGTTAVAYLNGIAQSTQSSDYYTLPASNTIGLFLDNTQSTAQNEYSSGKIAWARFYDGALTAGEAKSAYESAIAFEPGTPAVPEPGAMTFLLAGLGAASLCIARRKLGH